MSDVVIKAEGLGKKYIIGHQAERERYTALRDVMVRNARGVWHKTRDLLQGKPVIQGDTYEEVWALKDVDFEIRRGEAVGIIGRNGAGKSTLLKILSRITEPSAGRVTIRGRVASLLEVGTGFHPELTGRENIYLNGAILGMTRAEIKRKFDEIVDFAGVEQFLDTPVKRYSSGMYVRLAFAVAAHLEPEILVVDEVLAVGDAEFQKKCLGKMGDVASEGRTVLFVSHNMAAIENLCRAAMLLDQGRIVLTGETNETVRRYAMLFDDRRGVQELTDPSQNRAETGKAIFEKVEIISPAGDSTSEIPVGADVNIRLHIRAFEEQDNVEIGVGLFTVQGLRLSGYNSRDLHNKSFTLRKNNPAVIDLMLKRVTLAPGLYKLNLLMRDQYGQALDFVDSAITFEVIASDFFGSGRLPKGSNLVYFDAAWRDEVNSNGYSQYSQKDKLTTI